MVGCIILCLIFIVSGIIKDMSDDLKGSIALILVAIAAIAYPITLGIAMFTGDTSVSCTGGGIIMEEHGFAINVLVVLAEISGIGYLIYKKYLNVASKLFNRKKGIFLIGLCSLMAICITIKAVQMSTY